MLEGLKHATSNRCVRKCETPKYVFLVDRKANKREIAQAVESLYADKKIKVKGVNVINTKPKKRRVRGYSGFRAQVKKAIVSLETGDMIEEGA
jgi:large subunit ribosomal protein L23